MIGRRVYPGDNGRELDKMEPGDYGKGRDGRWYAMTPNGLLAGINNHTITEHEDGTITASPSILVKGAIGADPSKVEWHGFLERGVWRSC